MASVCSNVFLGFEVERQRKVTSKESLDGKPCIYAKNYLPSHKVKIIQRQSSRNYNASKGIFLRYLLLDCLVQLGERKAALELGYLLPEVTVCSVPFGD